MSPDLAAFLIFVGCAVFVLICGGACSKDPDEDYYE